MTVHDRILLSLPPGWCSRDKARLLIDAVLLKQRPTVVEVGVFGGDSLFVLAQAARHVDGVAWGIDPWSRDDALAGMADGGANREWWGKLDLESIYRGCASKLAAMQLGDCCRLLRCRSTDPLALEAFSDGSVDVFHLDGNHGPQSLLDAQAWDAKLKVGAHLFFDDLNWYDGSAYTNRPAYEWLLSRGYEPPPHMPIMVDDCALLVKH